MYASRAMSFLRGGTTPAHVAAGCALGGMIGLVPPQSPAVGLLVLLGALSLLANVNGALVLLAAIAGRLLSVPLLGASFATGRVLLDGPASPIFGAAINAPVLGLLGLEYYTATGGVVVGAALGGAGGALAGRVAGKFRRRLSGLEEGSALHRDFVARPASRAIASGLYALPLSGRGWKERLLTARQGPVRRGGLVALLALGTLTGAVLWLARDRAAALAASSVLERVFGRSAAVEAAEWDWRSGRLVLRDVRVADGRHPGRDLLRATEVKAQGVRVDLWRGRLAMDRVDAANLELWVRRRARSHVREPGPAVAAAAPGPAPRTASNEPTDLLPGANRLGDVFADPEPWSALAASASDLVRWLGRDSSGSRTRGGPGGETLTQRVSREREAHGPSRVAAAHLLHGRARLAVGLLDAQAVSAPDWGGRDGAWTLRIVNASTHPWLGDASSSLEVASTPRRVDVRFEADPADGTARLVVALGPFDTDGVMAGVILPTPRLLGGTLSAECFADFSRNGPPLLDTVLLVRGDGCRIHPGDSEAPGLAPAFVLRVGVNGPLADPDFSITIGEWERALGAVGAADLAARLRAQRAAP